MQLTKPFCLLFFLALITIQQSLFAQSAAGYINYKDRHLSTGKQSYYIDPLHGNDKNTGISIKAPWKTFKRINQLILAPGDALNVISPGIFHESLVLVARGTKTSPVKVKFAPGRYDFFPDGAIKKQLHISNTNDVPYGLKAIALMFDSCRFVNVEATGARIELRGKMIETFVNSCNNISLNGFSFDYQRPTVSELKVIGVGANYADVLIHNDSKFSIKDSVLTWQGEGWSHLPYSLWQVLDPATNDVHRIDIPQEGLRYVAQGGNKVRIYGKQSGIFKQELIYQNRDVTRDCSGIFMNRSKNIVLNNIRIYFMHGMGVVSQYCENIKMVHVVVKPDSASGRTCAAWADILHFSGCKGKIEIANSYLSAANDDAINIHGTHLKIVEQPADNQIKVRFMHGQTYGFDAFSKGDSIDIIPPKTLLPYAHNKVISAQKINDKDILLTLALPQKANIGDVVENTTATPQVWIHNNTITRIPTRGILVTSRRKVRIDHNNLLATHMGAIFINDDASNWYESGMVKDFVISQNKFVLCGEPVIEVHPENTEVGDKAVHSNFSVLNNDFILKGIEAVTLKSTSNIKVIGNTLKTSADAKNVNEFIRLENCAGVTVSKNNILKVNN
jgi:hypothetical protein